MSVPAPILQMEYRNHHQHQQYEQSNKSVSNTNCSTAAINGQVLNSLSRNVLNSFGQFGTEYGHDINFADSPSSPEKAWADEMPKNSPRLQITDIQTLYYNNNGPIKRRIDWDALDINQNGNASQHQQHPEARKEKREKISGRIWNDDIEFELSNEFNSNAYLNNENFLPISPGLTVLKKDAQTADQSKANKASINVSAAVVSAVAATVPPDAAVCPPQLKTERLSSPLSCLNSQENLQHILHRNEPVPQDTTSATATHEFEQATSGLHKISLRACPENAKAYGNEITVAAAGVSQVNEVPANKSEKLLAHTEDNKFQYILAAATSIATKNNEETLTYLNQGQSYEIKLKKIGDLSFYRDKILKSIIKICFHERRLQFIEREQIQQWQLARPGERIVEVDVPLSYGLCHVSQPIGENQINTVEVLWDPFKEVGVYIKVNCISTEFTPKKHGGEKGVPFRLQIETYIEKKTSGTAAEAASQSPTAGIGNRTPPISNPLISLPGNKLPISAAACQIKVFKLKGADRKHKQDKEKMQKRPQAEQDKFQPSYECTIMNEIPLELTLANTANHSHNNGDCSPEYMKINSSSPMYGNNRDNILPSYVSPTASPVTENSISSTNSPTLKFVDSNNLSAQQSPTDVYDCIDNIMPESTPNQVAHWLTAHRLAAHLSTFTHFSGSDIMRMSKEDLIQICGVADGIRMFNCLRAKAIAPRLTIYVCFDASNGNYNAIFLISTTIKELTQKLMRIPGFYDMIANNGNTLENGNTLYNGNNMHSKFAYSGSNIYNDGTSFICLSGPAGVHVTLTDDVLNNDVKDGSLYTLELQNGKVIMKLSNRNDN